jgi:hydroxypyruvate isomerase
LSGKTETLKGSDAYLDSLRFALHHTRLRILIEPICREQMPGYFLNSIEQAAGILAEIGNPRLKILFDCYHIHHEGGSVLERFRTYADLIEHVQIASSQNRSEPFPSQLDYRFLLPRFQSAGYHGPFGCEYRPHGRTEDGLAWREMFTTKSRQKPSKNTRGR